MENKPIFRPDPDAELMDQVRQVLHYYHYAYRTESHYCRWILRYIEFFGGKTHPGNLMQNILKIFLSHPATKGNVAASTQRKALNALVFLYRDVLDQPPDGRIAPVRSKRKSTLPTILTQEEVQQMLWMISGAHNHEISLTKR